MIVKDWILAYAGPQGVGVMYIRNTPRDFPIPEELWDEWCHAVQTRESPNNLLLAVTPLVPVETNCVMDLEEPARANNDPDPTGPAWP